MYKLIFIIVLLFVVLPVSAQDTLNSKIVEQKSYQLYLNKNWNELILFGSKAMEKGFDYYYLRMRTGIAYYEQQNYREAQKHFWKAYAFNSTDELLMEYLYYCYIYLGQFDEASKFSKSFPPALANKTKTNSTPAVEYAMEECGVKMTANNNLSNAYYLQFGLGHKIGKNISFFHAVTIFDQKGNGFDLDQKQYYLSACVPVSKSWLISPAIHIVDKKITFNDAPVQPKPASAACYFLGSLAVKRSVSYFDITLCSSVSNIDSITQIQEYAALSCYPLGNKKLSFTSIGYVQTENNINKTNFAFSQQVAFCPMTKISVAVNYFYNQAYRINEANGYIVNNSGDLSSSRWTAMGILSLSLHLDLYLLYQFENKVQNNAFTKTTINYSYNTVIGGLKLKL